MERFIIKLFFIPLRVRIRLIQLFRKITRDTRVLPDFIIIGAQKSGTSSLINYLKMHPDIKIPYFQKEPHYFDGNFQKGVRWYKSFFPTKLFRGYRTKIKKLSFITGEKSPDYLFHPLAARRIYSLLPNVKLIILLRNPVVRAYSHYQHSVRNKRENLPFEKAIEKENERLNGEREKIVQHPLYKSFNYAAYSYLTKGRYIEHIKSWFKFFTKDQIIIIKSEDMFRSPQKSMNAIFEFLNISIIQLKEFKKFFTHKYTKINEKLRDDLKEYFKPYNQQLYDYLGINFNWDNE